MADSQFTLSVHPVGDVLYVHTHLAPGSADLVGMGAYAGRRMVAHIADRGAVKETRIQLLSVDPVTLTATFDFKGREFTEDLFDVFGSQCTHVLPDADA